MVDESLDHLKISFDNGTFNDVELVYTTDKIMDEQMVVLWVTLSHNGDINRKLLFEGSCFILGSGNALACYFYKKPSKVPKFLNFDSILLQIHI